MLKLQSLFYTQITCYFLEENKVDDNFVFSQRARLYKLKEMNKFIITYNIIDRSIKALKLNSVLFI